MIYERTTVHLLGHIVSAPVRVSGNLTLYGVSRLSLAMGLKVLHGIRGAHTGVELLRWPTLFQVRRRLADARTGTVFSGW